jgi:predicted DNA-binding ribbon-helix-helix protein
MKYARFNKPLTIALENEIYLQIKDISEKQRISMAEWVREMLAKALGEVGVREKIVSLTYKLTSEN